MNLYQQTSYKDIIKGLVHEHTRYTFQAMAEHCRIQKTYLSKVLNHKGHLSEDQLFMALDYLHLPADDREYVELLYGVERSQLPVRRQMFETRLALLRAQKLRTETNLEISVTQITHENLTESFLDPLYIVIHMCLTIRRLQNDPDTIGKRLGLRPEVLRMYLLGLARMKLVRLTETSGRITRLQVLQDSLHLPEDSVLQAAYSMRMRLNAYFG